MFKSIHRIVFVMLATLAFAACGNATEEETQVSTTVAATTTTSATTPIPEVTTTTEITTTTVEETTTSSEEVTEQITSDLDFGSCSFGSQTTPVDSGARIKIDSIDLDDKLLFGLTNDADAPAWCDTSSIFGNDGKSFVGAHRTTMGGAFRNLPKLSIDDKIFIDYNGIRYEYQVIEAPVAHTVAEAARILQGDSISNHLVMYTCGPEEGQDTHRWIVTAKLVNHTTI